MYELMSREEISRVDAAAMEVLEKTGVLVEHDDILNLLENAGARIDRGRRIARLSEPLVRESLTKAPSSFKLYSRTGEEHVIGENNLFVSSGGGAIWMLDLDTGEPRPTTKKDIEDTSRVTDALEHFDLCSPTGIPQDVKPTVVDVMAAEAMMIHTVKPYLIAPADGEQARYIIEMAEAVSGGVENLMGKPLLLGIVSPNSPLRLARHDLDVVSEFANHKLPITILNCTISGATSPVTVAGTLVQTFAEILSMATVVQLINPGNPLLLGLCPACIDMKTAYATFGCPENALVTAAGTQMLRYYKLPSWCCAAEVDSILPDAQAGFESVWNTLLSVITGMNVISGTGHLGAAGGSLEKLVIDNEILGGIKRIRKGVEVTGETLSVDVIDAVGPGGQFLSHRHSREHLRNERWFPDISYKSNLEEWKKNRVTLWGMAKKRAMEILRTHQVEPLPEDTEEKIKGIAKRAESHIPSTY